jgi:methyltransferase (TIGR00027 family)
VPVASSPAADTAFPIAAIRAIEVERPPAERLFDDPYSALFASAGAHAAEGTARFLALPFFIDAIRLRTRFIDDVVRDSLRAGLTQLVLLGSGFDMRPWRMRELTGVPNVTTYEIDFPAQLERKRAILDAARVPFPASVAQVPCDFTENDFERALAPALAARGFRLGAGALFVWEGVIGYLDAAAVDRSLRFMATSGGPSSAVVFDFAPMAFEPDPASERTKRAGFARYEEIAFDAIWRRYLAGEPHAHAAVPHMGTAFV